ncbi:hypothetical protein U1Q18_029691 [Sarracenia purpurea var. burkii]
MLPSVGGEVPCCGVMRLFAGGIPVMLGAFLPVSATGTFDDTSDQLQASDTGILVYSICTKEFSEIMFCLCFGGGAMPSANDGLSYFFLYCM